MNHHRVLHLWARIHVTAKQQHCPLTSLSTTTSLTDFHHPYLIINMYNVHVVQNMNIITHPSCLNEFKCILHLYCVLIVYSKLHFRWKLFGFCTAFLYVYAIDAVTDALPTSLMYYIISLAIDLPMNYVLVYI
jgi:hypothetical protein